jgi:hypothetical protein
MCDQALGGTAETHYYASGEHVVTLDPQNTADATAATISFFDRHLK